MHRILRQDYFVCVALTCVFGFNHGKLLSVFVLFEHDITGCLTASGSTLTAGSSAFAVDTDVHIRAYGDSHSMIGVARQGM